MKQVKEVLKLSPLLLTLLLLSVDLTRPPEFVEIVLLFTPFLLLITTYFFGSKDNRLLKRNRLQTFPGLLLLLLIVFTMSTFFTTNVILSTYSLMRWVAIITTLVIISRHVTWKSTKVLSIFIQALGTVYSLLFLITQAFKIDFPNYLNTIRPVGEHYQLASLLVVSIPLIFSNLLAKRVNKSTAVLSKIALAVNLVALVFTFARGAWLVLLLLPVLLFFVKKESVVSLKRNRIMLILISGAVIGVISLGLSNDLQHSNNKVGEARNFKNLHQQSLNVRARASYFSQALSRFKQNPVWGTGLNTYTNSRGEIRSTGGTTSYTHNFLLQTLTETGIFSLVIFVVIFSYVVYKLFTKAQKTSKPTNIGVFLAFSLSLLYSFYDFNLNLLFVMLSIFSLAILVICSSANLRTPSLTRLGSFLNGFTIVWLVALEVFIITGLYSTVLQLKADRLKENGNHDRAGELYLGSLKVFPFTNYNFKETIIYFDYYFPEKSEAVIEKWTKLNRNDGLMYIFLANRSLNNENPEGALKYINILLESELRPIPDSGTVQRILEMNSIVNDSKINLDLLEFIGLINEVSFGQPNIYFSWPAVSSYYSTVIDLSRNLEFESLSHQDQRLILDQALHGYFILDNNIIENSNQIIRLLDQLIITDPGSDQYVVYKDIIVDLGSAERTSLETVDQLILRLGPNIEVSDSPTIHNLLLSQLHMIKASYYQGLEDLTLELQYIDKAIQISPATGSFRIYKIKRLEALGLVGKSDQALEECVVKLGPLCRQ